MYQSAQLLIPILAQQTLRLMFWCDDLHGGTLLREQRATALLATQISVVMNSSILCSGYTGGARLRSLGQLPIE